ncbi:HET-domain-containing protein [Bimuria novae-zelandiae CBS 107.79]|uniref:HET-domain-containing protein n=1 Tax=Bimuria novae-zelandiae CBS 107.79 TaxID=1447943 RepID=A0A6A5VMH4_9PLEO|nr:HET-domain-containing protein [Bimuria novae-zelandiae CBS 107.79]
MRCTGKEKIPPYVILSHTWGDEGNTFDDIHELHARNMQGYSKIERCCHQTAEDGFEWAWIDTCCIDKRSSSELSEAINSMYRWYWDANICYAFLSDMDMESFQDPDPLDLWLRPLWFYRGWCLQELLAPPVVEFYNRHWVCIGTKSSVVDEISAITQIDRKYLLDRHTIQGASIATRSSWMSSRNTTRLEDIAYSLLRLVDVNVPLLYGEGSEAFHRLQPELIKKTNDHTIFAWDQHLARRLQRDI